MLLGFQHTLSRLLQRLPVGECSAIQTEIEASKVRIKWKDSEAIDLNGLKHNSWVAT